MARKLVIFDIDGTLTRTNEADEECFAKTVAEKFGIQKVSTDWSDYTHSTDSGIIRELVERHRGKSPDDVELEDFRKRFVRHLEAYYSSVPNSFSPVQGAQRIFRALLDHPRAYAVAIATGGWKMSALMKLGRAEIDISNIPASFAGDHLSRDEIIQRAERLSREHYGSDFEKIVYVGDGRWDLLSSQRLGISFVGITDHRDPSMLKNLGATHLHRDFGDLEAFLLSIEAAPALKLAS